MLPGPPEQPHPDLLHGRLIDMVHGALGDHRFDAPRKASYAKILSSLTSDQAKAHAGQGVKNPGQQGTDVTEPAREGPAANNVIMALRGGPNGGPVYYGTQEARDRAIQGLANVARAFGQNSPQFRSASQAAAGVLGPDHRVPAGAIPQMAGTPNFAGAGLQPHMQQPQGPVGNAGHILASLRGGY